MIGSQPLRARRIVQHLRTGSRADCGAARQYFLRRSLYSKLFLLLRTGDDDHPRMSTTRSDGSQPILFRQKTRKSGFGRRAKQRPFAGVTMDVPGAAVLFQRGLITLLTGS